MAEPPTLIIDKDEEVFSIVFEEKLVAASEYHEFIDYHWSDTDKTNLVRIDIRNAQVQVMNGGVVDLGIYGRTP